jgi:hypothetical protein
MRTNTGYRQGSKYDVSSALTFAAAAIVIPFDRLRHDYHPSRDTSHNTVLKRAFDGMMREKFLESRLAPGRESHSWCFGRLLTVEGDPDAWPELQSLSPLPLNTKTRHLLFHLRNALSHGNIFTEGDPIQRITFLSETEYRSGVFNYLIASPADFRDLLQKWFSFLAGGKLPSYVLPDFLPEPASPPLP